MKQAKMVDTADMAIDRAMLPFAQYVKRLLVDPPGIIPHSMTPMAAVLENPNAKQNA